MTPEEAAEIEAAEAFAMEAPEKIRRLEADRDRYRLAWQSARGRAKAYGESIGNLCGERETCLKWAEAAEAQVAALQRDLAEAKQLAAEWQAACEAQSSDADVLTDAIQRVRALHSPETNPRRTRDCKGCRTVATYTLFEDCKTIAALESRPDDPEEIRRLAESTETET